MTLLKLSAEDFAPAPPPSDAERIARPSLSYWEDAQSGSRKHSSPDFFIHRDRARSVHADRPAAVDDGP